jgi:ribosomal protein L7/L12
MSLIYVTFLLILVIVLLHFGRIEDLRRRIQALARIETKLDLLLQHAGIEFEPYKGLPAEAIAALKRGEKIGAIKAYRAVTQISLKDAKDRIDRAQRLADL